MPTFIETQFPIARLSAESYKERRANNSQTLTGLGKWWGRKPLILVRASILGMLMPASGDAKKDREIFLKILTMDDDGALQRWKLGERFSQSELSVRATAQERTRWDELDQQVEVAVQHEQTLRAAASALPTADAPAKTAARQRGEAAELAVAKAQMARNTFIEALQERVFTSLPYADRLTRCERPENVQGPSEAALVEINAHLGTNAANLSELVEQLGQRTFAVKYQLSIHHVELDGIPFNSCGCCVDCGGHN